MYRNMKTLILVALLLMAHAAPARTETRTCTGRVRIDVIRTTQELYPKGSRQFSVGGCVVENAKLQKQVLRTCPLGSWCRVEGTDAGDDAIEPITSVTRVPMLTQYRTALSMCLRSAQEWTEQENAANTEGLTRSMFCREARDLKTMLKRHR